MQPRILHIASSFQTSTAGTAIPTRVITYMVGPHGPFRLELAEAEFSAELVQQRLQQEALTIQLLVPPA